MNFARPRARERCVFCLCRRLETRLSLFGRASKCDTSRAGVYNVRAQRRQKKIAGVLLDRTHYMLLFIYTYREKNNSEDNDMKEKLKKNLKYAKINLLDDKKSSPRFLPLKKKELLSPLPESYVYTRK